MESLTFVDLRKLSVLELSGNYLYSIQPLAKMIAARKDFTPDYGFVLCLDSNTNDFLRRRVSEFLTILKGYVGMDTVFRSILVDTEYGLENMVATNLSSQSNLDVPIQITVLNDTLLYSKKFKECWRENFRLRLPEKLKRKPWFNGIPKI